MLTFYTNPMSRGRMIRWMLEELAEPYEIVILTYGAEMNSPTYLALNPMAKVPTLVHDGHIVTEVAAICTYLALTFPEKQLMAADSATFLRWMFFAAGPVEAAVTNSSLGWQVTEPAQQARLGYGSLDRVVHALESHLEQHDYIADNRFTAADVYIGSQIGWGLHFKTLPERPAFTAYWDRLKDRPAQLAAEAKDNALLPAKA